MSMEWLKNLKAGNTVIVKSSCSTKQITTVDKITPTGRIVVDKKQYGLDGHSLTSDIWASSSLLEATTESIAEVIRVKKRNESIKALLAFDYSGLKDEQLEEILNVIKKNDEEGEKS